MTHILDHIVCLEKVVIVFVLRFVGFVQKGFVVGLETDKFTYEWNSSKVVIEDVFTWFLGQLIIRSKDRNWVCSLNEF